MGARGALVVLAIPVLVAAPWVHRKLAVGRELDAAGA
jgi:hypothetical protein